MKSSCLIVTLEEMVISYPEKMEITKLSYKFEFSHKRKVGMKTPSNHRNLFSNFNESKKPISCYLTLEQKTKLKRKKWSREHGLERLQDFWIWSNLSLSRIPAAKTHPFICQRAFTNKKVGNWKNLALFYCISFKSWILSRWS